MRMTKDDMKPYKPKKDAWDLVLDSYKKDIRRVSLSENKKKKENLEKVISFRVTETQYNKLMARFGDPSGIRETLVTELAPELEEINIQENSGEVIELDD
jgi:hypothetical protein